jgi:hypothetical protein
MKWVVREITERAREAPLPRATARLPGSSLDAGAYVPRLRSAHGPPLHRGEPPWNCPAPAAIRLARAGPARRIVCLSLDFRRYYSVILASIPKAAESLRQRYWRTHAVTLANFL